MDLDIVFMKKSSLDISEFLKEDCHILINELYEEEESYCKNLIELIEKSKTLASLYVLSDNVNDRIKYDSIGESALRQLNKYLF